MDDSKIKANQNNWNKTYTQFEGWCALPTWGPYEVGKDDPSLIGKVEGKIFLEICCGSGHSIKYLIENGAKKVYAIDFSENQISLAKKTNATNLDKIEFILSPMEKIVDLTEKVVTEGSYHDESEHHLKTFQSGEGVYQVFRKSSTWFNHLRDAGFEINRYLEPKPININEDIATISSSEMADYYTPMKGEKLPSVIIFECIKPNN
ncbi:MAG: class I SAM-dependent methyltransferase [Candidatus Taylorbacteria bacterium]